MPKYIRYNERGIIKYLVTSSYFRYFKYILTNNSTKYNIYILFNTKQRVLEKIEKKLADK